VTRDLHIEPAPERAATFWQNSIGLKAAMSVSGLLMALFLIEHVIGNFTVYGGRAVMNAYARALDSPVIIWGIWAVRGLLLAALLVHVIAALLLTWRRRRARPAPYARRANVQASVPSLTMFWTGLAILAYAIFHVLHMALGVGHPDFRGIDDVYDNLTLGLRRGLPAAIYLAAMVALGLHLWHGLYSFLTSLGRRSRRSAPKVRSGAAALGTALALAFASIPIAILAGLGGG
jgi:succinate dehydrogenase / fumarate reductase cytochrome b subunit